MGMNQDKENRKKDFINNVYEWATVYITDFNKHLYTRKQLEYFVDLHTPITRDRIVGSWKYPDYLKRSIIKSKH